MSFAKNIGKHLSNKFGQKLLDSAKKSTTDAIKTAESTGDLIGNKTADKITSVSKTSPTEFHSKELQNGDMEAPKKDIYLQKKDNKLLMN